jgi:hypothetical protein
MTDQIGASHMVQGEKTTFVVDRFGCPNSALALNQGWTQVPSDIYFNTPQITISAWILPQQLGTWSRLIDFGNGGQKDNINVPIAYFLLPKPSFYIFSTTPTLMTISSQNLTLGQWQLLTVTHDGTFSRIYINGTQVASLNQVYTLPTVNRTNCYIGKSYNAASGDGISNSYFDDLRFYNKALTQAEILQLMNQPQTGRNIIKNKVGIFFLVNFL